MIMQFISGIFKGNYRGKEVEPLNLQTYSALHYLEVDPGASMHNCEWVNDYSNDLFINQFIRIHSIPGTDFHFNREKFPEEVAFRDNLHSCVLLNPQIHSITRKNGYTYGIIEGKLLGTIGNFLGTTAVDIPQETSKNRLSNLPSLPIAINTPGRVFAAHRPSTWRWANLLTLFFWTFLFGWGLWWLMNHRGCDSVPDNTSSSKDTPKKDSTLVKDDNDTLQLHAGNMTFSVYDWSIEDNDTISLLLNGQVIRDSIPLTNSIVSWMQPLVPAGSNTLLIKSINNGTIGPASPTIEINDGRNNQIFQIRVLKGHPKKLTLLVNK
jgi:hypothetical protein